MIISQGCFSKVEHVDGEAVGEHLIADRVASIYFYLVILQSQILSGPIWSGGGDVVWLEGGGAGEDFTVDGDFEGGE